MEMTQSSSNSLEEAARKRKERLNNFKRKRQSDTTSTNPGKAHLPKPKFRSYNPQDEDLQKQIVPSALAGDVVSKVQGQLESAKSKVVIDELDISNLAPRKPDWDLKRDVAKKLEKLERRTQKAIAELIRERLRQRQADLAVIADVDPPT